MIAAVRTDEAGVDGSDTLAALTGHEAPEGVVIQLGG
jgi:hypothetical protein